ncbi:MAG: hypothetical protein IPH77_10550 [Ignavibacteria bacterium]|nr:hypothetical protein [Ignavibacteria bacterium]
MESIMFSGRNLSGLFLRVPNANATVPCPTTVCVTYVIDCPLPVELSSFTSAVSGRDVSLNWSTASEENNARFEIERSSTENNWFKSRFS